MDLKYRSKGRYDPNPIVEKCKLFLLSYRDREMSQ